MLHGVFEPASRHPDFLVQLLWDTHISLVTKETATS